MKGSGDAWPAWAPVWWNKRSRSKEQRQKWPGSTGGWGSADESALAVSFHSLPAARRKRAAEFQPDPAGGENFRGIAGGAERSGSGSGPGDGIQGRAGKILRRG